MKIRRCCGTGETDQRGKKNILEPWNKWQGANNFKTGKLMKCCIKVKE